MMADWQPIETAPTEPYAKFLAVNHDGEVWVAAREQHGRLVFRTHQFREPKRFTMRKIDGEEWLREDKAYCEQHSAWEDNWTLWTQGYEFKPTHWMPLPDAPVQS